MISQLLAGEKGVRLSTLDKVAAALNVDVSELFSPAPPMMSAETSGLQALLQSAIAASPARQHIVTAPDVGARPKILIDPEELRAIGFAIGNAIVEATQKPASPRSVNGRSNGGQQARRTRKRKRTAADRT
jgi:hypothetical protein